MTTIRTFVAVAAGLGIRQRAIQLIGRLGQRVSSFGDIKWVAADNLHWTLQFLGNLDERAIPEVCDAVSTAAAEIEPFDLEARGAGAFPSPGRPRTLWIGAGKGERAMTVLHSAVDRRLKKRGYRGEERRYVPHMTIGRAGRTSASHSLEDELARLADYDAGTMVVDEVTVYSSQLARGGPMYEVLARAPLAP
jgi:RNA 2',3'-cyclic 3'-phosphodiesterase